MKIALSIYRYDPEKDQAPMMQEYSINSEDFTGNMLLDALLFIKTQDETLTLRRSCREGVCGSDAMNINGKNGLACVTPLAELKQPIVIRPLPGLPVIKDLVVDMSSFYKQYEQVKPYLQNNEVPPAQERLQSPEDRAKLDGLYECILCACCSSSCPSVWWNPDTFAGPAALLAADRFISDSRDNATAERLEELNEDSFKLYRCRNIMNCTSVCPKGLNPNKSIAHIRDKSIAKRG